MPTWSCQRQEVPPGQHRAWPEKLSKTRSGFPSCHPRQQRLSASGDDIFRPMEYPCHLAWLLALLAFLPPFLLASCLPLFWLDDAPELVYQAQDMWLV